MKNNEKKSKEDFSEIVENKLSSELETLIPGDREREKFLRVLKTAVFKNPKLLQAHRGSLLGACLKAAEWGMLPDGNEVGLVPFKGMVQAIPMVGGFLKRLFSDPNFEKIYAEVIFVGDHFNYNVKTEKETIEFTPKMFQRGEESKILGAFAGMVYKDGKAKFEIARTHEVERVIRVNRERQGHSKAWDQYPEEMVKKYMIKRMAKRVLCLQIQDELLTSEDFEPTKEGPKQASIIKPSMITDNEKKKNEPNKEEERRAIQESSG